MAVSTFSHPDLNPANRALLTANNRSYCLRPAATMLAVAIVVALLPGNTGAQGSRVATALEGTLRDSSGGLIQGVAVVVRNLSTNQVRTAETDTDGSFHAEALPVGSYEVSVDQTGFAPFRQAEIDLTLGQTTRLDIVLRPASSSEKITVDAQPEIVDTSQTSVVSSVDR